MSDTKTLNRKTLRSELMLLAASLIWGCGFIANKLALTTLTPFVILFWRFLLGALLCFIVFFKRIIKTPRRTCAAGMLIGCLQIAALGFQLTGLQYTTAAKQSFICSAYVALTPIVSCVLLHSRLKPRDIIAGCFSLCGIGIISLGSDLSLNRGDVLSLLYAVMYATQVVMTGKFVAKYTDTVQLTFFQFLTAGIVSAGIVIFGGGNFFSFGKESMIGVGYLVLMNTFTAYLLQNSAQKYVKDVTAALIISLYSLFGFIFSVLYFREPISARLPIGGAFCFCAVLISVLKKLQPQK